MESPGVRVIRQEAEATRRRLMELGVLRLELEVAKDGEFVVFPVSPACGPRLATVPWDFIPRTVRPNGYQDLLPPALRSDAPRAFDTLGDIIVVKVPPSQEANAALYGQALLEFHAARAVFADHGVQGELRTRRLECIAGTGPSLTQIRENGTSLWVDPAAAYFSPRLSQERARIASLTTPGETVIDLFGGVAPQGIQLAARGARVHSVDLNPAATELARRNAAANGHAITIHTGDARQVAATLPRAGRLIMNLPHGARAFLDVAARLMLPGGTLHYHEIMAPDELGSRARELEAELGRHGWPARVTFSRTVRNYSPQEAHIVFDVVGAPALA